MAIGNMVGASVRRHEDPKLVSGSGTFVDDIKLPGMLNVGIVPAVRLAGLAQLLTGQEVRARQKLPLPITWVIPPDIKTPEHWAMATDVVRYVGEPVAAIAVEDRYGIEDAL